MQSTERRELASRPWQPSSQRRLPRLLLRITELFGGAVLPINALMLSRCLLTLHKMYGMLTIAANLCFMTCARNS